MMKVVLYFLMAFWLLFPFISFGEEQVPFVRDNELQLRDIMPAFEYDPEKVLFPEKDDRFIYFSIESEDRNLDHYKRRLNDLIKEFDRFQGRY